MSNTNPACNKWPATAPFFGGPFPTRTWFRAGGAPCSGTAATRALAKKTEVLQYKGNSAQLTQKQKWAQIAKGKSHNKKQSWASQTQTVTNPNVNNLPQVRNTLICSVPSPTIDIVGDLNNGINSLPAYWELLTSEPQILSRGSFTTQSVIATGINSNKNVVGWHIPILTPVATYWNSLESTPVDLNFGGYIISFATSINNNQIITGFVISVTNFIPVYWSSPSALPTILNLVAPYSGNTSLASKINNKNEIVGFGTVTGPTTQVPLYWSSQSANPIPLNLIAPYAGEDSAANGINNKGEIVGYGKDGGGNTLPLYWSSSTADPTTLSYSSLGSNDIEANDINDDGIIVGFYDNGAINIAIYWTSPTAAPIPFNINPYSGNPSMANGIK
jgi:hypothetical protein